MNLYKTLIFFENYDFKNLPLNRTMIMLFYRYKENSIFKIIVNFCYLLVYYVFMARIASIGIK